MKHSAILGVKNTSRYNAGALMTFFGLAASIIGGIVALTGYEIGNHSLSDGGIEYPEEEAIEIVDMLRDNCSEDEEG